MMTVKRNGLQAKERMLYKLAGIAPPVTFSVHSSSVNNVARGVLERCFFVRGENGLAPPIPPHEGAFTQLNEFRRQLLNRFPWTVPLAVSEFPTLYQDRRRKIYEEAALSLLQSPVTVEDSFLDTFVKAEKLNLSNKPDPVPRIIQPRDPRYNVAVGRFLKPLEHKLYKRINKVFGSKVVFKGLNSAKRGKLIAQKWTKFKDPVAIGMDMNRFDQHVSVAALQFEHTIYAGCYRNNRELRRLLTWQLRNRGTAYCRDGSVKYSIPGRRMSGDMNTAMGNVLLMCAMLWWLKQVMGMDLEFVNDGDDTVIICDRMNVLRLQITLQLFFAQFGFDARLEEPVYSLEEIEFCQCHPVFVGPTWTDYIMVRNCPISIAKDACSIKPWDNENSFRRWAGAIGDCGMSLTGGIPIFQAFYKKLRELSGGLRMGHDPTLETGMFHLAIDMHRLESKVSPRTRASFSKAFGISPTQQVNIEWEISQYNPLLARPSGTDENPSLYTPNWY